MKNNLMNYKIHWTLKIRINNFKDLIVFNLLEDLP